MIPPVFVTLAFSPTSPQHQISLAFLLIVDTFDLPNVVPTVKSVRIIPLALRKIIAPYHTPYNGNSYNLKKMDSVAIPERIINEDEDSIARKHR